MRQETKAFLYRYNDPRGPGAIDDQINRYLAEHAGYKVSQIGYVLGGNFEKALVVFDIREEKEETRTGNGQTQSMNRGSGNNGGGKNRHDKGNTQSYRPSDIMHGGTLSA